MSHSDEALKKLEELLHKSDAVDEKIRGIQETLYLLSIPGMKESILAGMNQPIEDCISWEELKWELANSDD